MAEDTIKLKRVAKGERPVFFEDPNIDRLVAMIMGLVGEVSVIRDRLDTVERLAQERGLFTQADIEAYEPSEQALMERAQLRKMLLGKVTRIISSEVEALERDSEQS